MANLSDESPWLKAGLLVGLVFLLYELIIHLADIFHGLFWSLGELLKIFGQVFIICWTPLATAIGAGAASTVVISCVSIPVTTVTIYWAFTKAEEKPRLYIYAIGMFLDPLFIDFFKDKIHDDQPIQKMLVSAFGIVTFLAATGLWSQSSKTSTVKSSKGLRFFVRATSVFLYLLPSLCVLVYVVIDAQAHREEFVKNWNTPNVVGLIGLVLTSILGIMLSRYFEGP